VLICGLANLDAFASQESRDSILTEILEEQNQYRFAIFGCFRAGCPVCCGECGCRNTCGRRFVYLSHAEHPVKTNWEVNETRMNALEID
jgi:hypothetical protein